MYGWLTNAALEFLAFQRQQPKVRRPRTAQRRLRQRLYRRDNGMCRYCGDKVTFEDSTIDEVVPFVHGGRRTLDNTVLACWDCNHRKGPLLLDDPGDLAVDALKARWASLDTIRNSELRPDRLPK